MAIKMPKSSAAEKFIAAAPDAAGVVTIRKGVPRGKREQITHTLPPELLAKIDAQAQSRGMTRAGFINYAISRALDDLGRLV